MSDHVLFNPEPYNSSNIVELSTSGFQKPTDSLDVPPAEPDTIWYLAIIKPHVDSHEIIGPVKSFKRLLPKVHEIASNSPRAIDKLDELVEIEDMWGEREKNWEFERNGFERFIVEGQRGAYTVLKAIRETNKGVFETLPAPVYTVVSVGPLEHGEQGSAKDSKYTKPKGCAETTTVHGSWLDSASAVEAARGVMEDLLVAETHVRRTESWDKDGKGSGIFMAMSGTLMWEVKVIYDDQAVKRAMEEAGRVGNGKV